MLFGGIQRFADLFVMISEAIRLVVAGTFHVPSAIPKPTVLRLHRYRCDHTTLPIDIGNITTRSVSGGPAAIPRSRFGLGKSQPP